MDFKQKKKRVGYMRFLKWLMKSRYKQPAFIYVDEKFDDGTIILSNHEGTDAPMAIEIYFDRAIRMWGTGEMNSGLKRLYKYQTKVYYHEKKGWNLTLARLFCLLASPLTYLFYNGFDLISVFPNAKFITTLRESLKALDEKDNILIFPEGSSEGYLEELKGFFAGFITICETGLKKGKDIPLTTAYYRKKDNVYFFDKPILYSELKKICSTKEEMCDYMCSRCNALNKITLNEETIKNAQNKDGVVITLN
ncbi:MAG: hypothetical protein E7342_03375 [Clostridiales bacterium]|nr:hypothetical protein [Clostridiales bacterium]